MAREVLLIIESRIATVEIIEQLLAHLSETGTLRTRTRTLAELSPDDLTSGTYPLLVRSVDPLAIRLTAALRRARVAYGFYLDDNFWLLDPETEIGRHYAATPVRKRLEAIVRGASPVIAATPLLRDYLLPRNPDTIQLDSFYDFTLAPTMSPRSTRRGVRGGFAASTQRGQDLRDVIDEVIAVLDAHPEAEFEIIGARDEAIPAHPRIRWFPYLPSYEEYVAFQRSRRWDFGLAPLGGAASNLYKTDNKYREYAAQGIPGVYQDAPPYASVRDGETGIVAGGARSWRAAMELLVGDPALRERIRRSARADAESRLSLGNVAPQWGAFFAAAPGVGDDPARLERVRRELAPPPSVAARAILRARLLWDYGMTSIADRGVLATAARTLRFVGKRMIGR
ncbi:MAG: hypothetical protein KF727_02540 [Microbacteriaceae bacterium]|nr:hypothetical protein [Microbacteriaceae bacterium]